MKITDKQTESEPLFWQPDIEVHFDGNDSVAQFGDSSIAGSSTPAMKGDFLVKALKRILLFLPGAILLFGATNLILLAFFNHIWDLTQVAFSLPALLIYGFMVMFGLGDIRNPKHLLLPGSIVFLSFVICLLPLFLSGSGKIPYLFSYSFYLMPLVLMAPVLTKQWLESGPQ